MDSSQIGKAINVTKVKKFRINNKCDMSREMKRHKWTISATHLHWHRVEQWKERKWHRCFCGEFGGGRVNFVATAAPFSGRLHQRSRHSLKNMWIKRWSKEVEKGWWKDATGGCWSSARVGDSLWVDCERAGANSPPATGIISWILACSQHSKKIWNYVY